MSRDKELTSATGHHHIDTTLLALRKQGQLGHLQDVLPSHLGVAAVRHIKLIIETPKDGYVGLTKRMAKDTKHLCRQVILRHTIEMIQSRLRCPTYI